MGNKKNKKRNTKMEWRRNEKNNEERNSLICRNLVDTLFEFATSYHPRAALTSMEPQENFRSLPLLPSTDDLFRGAFLRPNIVRGKYSNTEHYLDVQYRLLREDYVGSLRDAVEEYLNLNDGGKSVVNYKKAIVYENVRIVQKEFVKGTMHHLVQLPARKCESDTSFRLGSLLCLSSDDFKTLLFASVARRNPEQLKNGLLLIRFEDEGLNISTSKNFVIIETSAYFEGYRHNLKALQELNEDLLPLKEYIVDVKTDVKHPRYLDPSTTYDMGPLLVPMDSISIERETTADGEWNIRHEFPDVKKFVNILDDSNWPSASDLNLEISQYRALKAALTREFAIIQGPPGTSKTYVGMRIVQLLLHNKDKWFREDTNSIPILVVSVTDHALDQFLEGITSFTDKIVRIGNQGKNNAISQFQLYNLKRKPEHRCALPDGILTALFQQNEQIKRVERDIEVLSYVLQKCTKHVLSEEELKSYIPLTQYLSLKSRAYDQDFELFHTTDSSLILYDWLRICPGLVWNHFHNPSEVMDDVGDEVPNSQFDAEKSDDEIHNNEDIDAEDVDEDNLDVEFLSSVNNVEIQGGRKQRLKYIKGWLNKSKALEENEASKILNVWHLDVVRRWSLYKYWLDKMIAKKQEECLTLQARLKTLHEELREIKTAENLHVIKRAHVIGMTTTGAAKHRNLIRSVNPQILIVEEAAQILESHIVTALAPNTQHVILIGDHRQLRPLPNVHKLAVEYDTNISLFERMIKNKMNYFTLSVQHRMRPDITDLIAPHIYRVLENHPSVKEYENVRGVGRNLYFVTHNYSEMDEKNSKSKINEHEATFMIRLCNYLVQQGYDASQITVLTTYNGQLSVMKKIAEEFPRIEEVRFTVVDNFQGEENDIILISLVRSNDDADIGFLKIANRVCVALSRAKKGLYCIGDFELLAQKSDLWKNVTQTLKQKGAIGQSLQLSCQNHPNVCNEVSTAKDFDSAKEGGCTIMCNYRLSCGHVCSLNCPPYDPEHLNVRCFEKCNRKCEDGHACPLKCYEKCQPCEYLVDYTFPESAHTTQVPSCSKRSTDFTCDAKCERKLICKHTCPKKCGEICAEFCRETALFTSPICGHIVEIECYNIHCLEAWAKYCKLPCNAVLDCGHKCNGNCGDCYQGYLHVACNQPCKRILACGHECRSPCAKNCPPSQLPCENKYVHSKCTRKFGEPCNTCDEE